MHVMNPDLSPLNQSGAITDQTSLSGARLQSASDGDDGDVFRSAAAAAAATSSNLHLIVEALGAFCTSQTSFLLLLF